MTKFITPVLITLVLVLAFLVWKQQQQKQDIYHQEQQYFNQIYDSLQRELQSSKQERLVLNHRYDSLDSLNRNLKLTIATKNRELANVRGRYNSWSQDSLAREMNKRADGRVN